MVSIAFSYAQIYQLVLQIPPGSVATYGQIARLAGLPICARSVGYALSALDANSPVPWHRVVNAAGKISRRSADDCMENTQRIRLEQEGVVFDASGRIRLSRFRWTAAENK